MITPSQLFTEYKIPTVKSRRSERSDLLQSFVDTINAGRVGTKYKPLTIPYIGHLLSIYSTSDLYILKQKCDRAKNFSATFFWYVKGLPDNHKK
jgi:hypothetical protein